MIFEIIVILIALLFIIFLQIKDKHTIKKFVVIVIGVLLFEYFTQALWFNKNLESWSYLYLDVSWILTIGWATIVLVSMAIIEYYQKKSSELKKFILTGLVVSIIAFFAEWVVLALDIREYSAPVLKLIQESPLLFGILPLREAIYVPAFVFLIIAFVKYWEPRMEIIDNLVNDVKKITKRGKKR
jgi:FlaA1/EpsC-like NDP-sugar epimerase